MIMDNFINAREKELLRLNEEFGWSLNLAELKRAQKYFKELKRNPTRAEIETIAQTWSEHCKHKTFSGPVEFYFGKKKKIFKNLFKETIVYVTRKLNKKWCLSVFKDNAGIIEMSPKSKWALAFKAETHNHPCAIAPYGGAETGVGGVIRDILGTGLGAKPILNTDNFCFGPLEKEKMPKGFLSPKKIFEGVVEGVRDYGNRMGIPTAAGSVHFDESYLFNPLVYVGCVGLIKKNRIFKKVKKGNLIAVIGGPTGRDGIHGATFSSADIDENASSSAVQIGHAVNEKKVLDVIMKASERNLYDALTDCGAGGFSSAVGELGAETGVFVDLSKAFLKDSSIKPWEIWVSESQERMVLSVPKNKIKELEKICEIEECPICVLGAFDGSGKLRVFYKKEKLIDMDMSFLHGGIPKFFKKAVYNPKIKYGFLPKEKKDYGEDLKKILKDLNVCSKEEIVRQYDHEVQGGCVVKPFCGREGITPTDAAVIWPYSFTQEPGNFEGFAVSHGFNFSAGKIDPYISAFYAIDEAVRSLACVGADISRTALLDNFCCGNPNNPFILGDFTAAALGCRDAALAYKTPFISGKDSFYNQSKVNGKDYAITLSLLISAIAPIKDVRKAVSPEFKKAGNPIYLFGKIKKGLGASVYSKIFVLKNNILPAPEPEKHLKDYFALIKAIEKYYAVSAHDVSKGGIAAALTKMSFDGLSCEIDLKKALSQKGISETELLFSEGTGMILAEIDAKKEMEFLKIAKNARVSKIGFVSKSGKISVKFGEKKLIEEEANYLRSAWKNALRDKL